MLEGFEGSFQRLISFCTSHLRKSTSYLMDQILRRRGVMRLTFLRDD